MRQVLWFVVCLLFANLCFLLSFAEDITFFFCIAIFFVPYHLELVLLELQLVLLHLLRINDSALLLLLLVIHKILAVRQEHFADVYLFLEGRRAVLNLLLLALFLRFLPFLIPLLELLIPSNKLLLSAHLLNVVE